MKKIEINAINNLPEICFDGALGYFKISGNSYPQNAEIFYSPLIEYIQNYLQTPQPTTQIVCNIEYFQTTSRKFLIDIIKLLSNLKTQGLVLQIDWIYFDDEENEDIIIAGKEIEKLLNLNFNFIKSDTPL